MTKEEALELIKRRRVSDWNAYRLRNPDWVPDLSNADFSGTDLVPDGFDEAFNLSGSLLMGVVFSHNINFLTFDGRSVNVKDAIFDVDTRVPESFNPTGRGAKFVPISELGGFVAPEDRLVAISYAWVDEDVVLAIDQWLRTRRVKTRIDRRDFFAGSRVRDEIVRVFREAAVVLIMYSERAKDKPWPQFERELMADLEMEAKLEGRVPPRIIYVVVDGTPLPSVSEKARIAILAKGKRFNLLCEEIYHAILQLPKKAEDIDLARWEEYSF